MGTVPILKNAKKKFRDAQLSYLVTLTFLLGTILKLEIPINYLMILVPTQI